MKRTYKNFYIRKLVRKARREWRISKLRLRGIDPSEFQLLQSRIRRFMNVLNRNSRAMAKSFRAMGISSAELSKQFDNLRVANQNANGEINE